MRGGYRAITGAAVVALATAAAPAGAHVDVLPATVPQGTGMEFTMRVPNERDIPTTEVRARFPKQVTVYAFAPPPPGFTMRPTRSPDGLITGVVYRGRIPVGGYQDFTFLGTPFETGRTVWPTNQVYADGVVKRWIGPPDEPGESSPETGPNAPGPAAGVDVVVAAPETPSASPAGDGADAGSSGAGTWMGLAGLVAGVGALGWTAVGRRRERVPAPAGGEDSSDAVAEPPPAASPEADADGG